VMMKGTKFQLPPTRTTPSMRIMNERRPKVPVRIVASGGDHR